MTVEHVERLILVLRSNGVSHYKALDLEIRFDGSNPPSRPIALPPTMPTAAASEPVSGAAVPPMEMKIPHHLNEVASLLKLSDEQLVDRMFPEEPSPKAE